ncbi:ribonuclease P protein component [Candidatus Microgenomates bacterium]|nr:ribonuclease P protein component [Candidatus Microgenomates bacterium]
MLPKENRLNKKADFNLVSKKGQIVQSKNFGLAYLVTGASTPPKFGFIVSNKISKRAVDRNRIKRILRQIIRELIKDDQSGLALSTANGLLLVLLARKSILDASPNELKKELVGNLKQISALEIKNQILNIKITD